MRDWNLVTPIKPRGRGMYNFRVDTKTMREEVNKAFVPIQSRPALRSTNCQRYGLIWQRCLGGGKERGTERAMVPIQSCQIYKLSSVGPRSVTTVSTASILWRWGGKRGLMWYPCGWWRQREKSSRVVLLRVRTTPHHKAVVNICNVRERRAGIIRDLKHVQTLKKTSAFKLQGTLLRDFFYVK